MKRYMKEKKRFLHKKSNHFTGIRKGKKIKTMKKYYKKQKEEQIKKGSET